MEKHLEVCGIPPFDGPREINDFYYREVNPAQPTRTRVHYRHLRCAWRCYSSMIAWKRESKDSQCPTSGIRPFNIRDGNHLKLFKLSFVSSGGP